MAFKNPIFCAIDTADLAKAKELARAIRPFVGGLKLGLEFFCAHGPRGIAAVADGQDLPIFLDLKLHDIPNTVAKALEAVAPLAPAFVTLHASGGRAMMQAAAEGAIRGAEQHGTERIKLLAVTILTSLDGADLDDLGITRQVEDQVRALGALTKSAGIDGAVCSPKEVAALRADLGPAFDLMVPGIRPKGADLRDQKRVMGPGEALSAGASYLVIGRPITSAPDPAKAAQDIAESLERAL